VTRAAKRTERLEQRSATLPLRADGGLRVVVVADTHGEPHPESRRLITDLGPDAILHAGDIGDLRVLDGLAELAPLFAIRGNIDEHARDLPDALTLDVRSPSETVLRLLILHIAVYGPRLRPDAARRARESGASLVVCGHSHVPFIGRDRGLIVFNPGSIGPRRFRLPIVFGVLELAAGAWSMRHVDCETGRMWAP
jgi:uncharacterized protein